MDHSLGEVACCKGSAAPISWAPFSLLPDAGLGELPDPAAVEALGLPVFTVDGAEAGDSQTASTGSLQGADVATQPSWVVAAVGGGKKKKPQELQPFVFSQGFPPVPAKLIAKIHRLEYKDMAELLRDNVEADWRRGVQEETSNVSKAPRRDIPDILSWIQCFGIYISVMASKFPDRVPNMVAYQTTLVREAHQCGGGSWLAYDTEFRQQAAADPLCDWSKLNSSLYPVTFMAQASGKGRCCPHRLEPDHMGDDCALSPRTQQDQRLGQ